jgi:hypothetical protein
MSKGGVFALAYQIACMGASLLPVTHDAVSIVDVWAEYERLANEEGWTQQRIADAKGVAKSKVSEKIRYNSLPDEVKRLCSDGDLTEGHLEPISSLVPTSELFCMHGCELVTSYPRHRKHR